MYIRKTTKTHKGKSYDNYLLVESLSTPKGPRQKIVCSLGSLAPAAREHWLDLAHRMQASLAGQLALTPPDSERETVVARGRRGGKAQPTVAPGESETVLAIASERVSLEEAREAGAVHVGHQIWQQLGLNEILRSAGLSERACRLSEGMTLNRHRDPEIASRSPPADGRPTRRERCGSGCALATSPAPCSGPDDCPRRPRGLWENRRGPALIPPALAYNRAACPANNRAGLAGYSPLVPQNTWRSDRTGTACRPGETASSRPPPARPRWLGDGDAVDPNCDTELRRSSWQSPCPECRLVRCYGSNRAWHAPTTERSDDSASSLHSAGKHAPTVPRSARSRSTPAVARSDVPHERPRLRAP